MDDIEQGDQDIGELKASFGGDDDPDGAMLVGSEGLSTSCFDSDKINPFYGVEQRNVTGEMASGG